KKGRSKHNDYQALLGLCCPWIDLAAADLPMRRRAKAREAINFILQAHEAGPNEEPSLPA
ncbi:AGAP008215-PA, partial [Anopheles gambiae str. PEST]